MGMASHLGPWLLGTVKNTATIGGVTSTRNMGATVVSQQIPLVASSTVSCVLPAGSCIINAYNFVSTAGSPTTAVNLAVGATNIGTLSCAQGYNPLTATAAAVGTMANVGTSDVTVSFACPASIVGSLVIVYVVRNVDGSITPASTYNSTVPSA